jgi:hypothetical protein
MLLKGPNTKLLLIAHSKGILHALSLFGFGAAASMGCFPNLSSSKAHVSFLLLAGGAWLSFWGDHAAAWINATLPLAAEKAGAAVDNDGFNSTVIKLSAVAMAVGSVIMCTGIDKNTIMGGKAK